jgi:glutamate carboxypeptidase
MRPVTDIGKAITQYLEKREDEILLFLQTLAKMETPSSDAEAQQPLFIWLAERFRELGCYTLRVPGRQTGGYLYAREKKREKCCPIQLLLGHSDTVWPRETLAEMPIRHEADRLSGPGIYDMKAGITQIFFALKCIKELGLPVSVEPVVLINSDEEIGSHESSTAIARIARIADRALVLEPPLGLEGRLKTTRKGLGRFTLEVFGKAAHAGLDPQRGINAIVAMSDLVQQLYALNDHEGGITVNVGLIEGGISPNTIAPSSKVVVDVRVPTTSDGEKVEAAIRGLRPANGAVRLEVAGGFGRPPMEATPRNQQLWSLAALTGRQLGLRLQQAAAGGGSDANTTSQYTATLDGLGTPGDGAHAAHEYIYSPQFAERTALLSMLLLLEPLTEK